ncbi:hypothetical protein N9917_01535 [Deltaproteobacteria bacterium]|nr:hypothetical protein [Deltaproteobacteria bacterium]
MWTITLLGGEPFSINAPGNPPLRHDGRRSLTPVYGDKDLIEGISIYAEGQGCMVRVVSELAPKEAEEERQLLLDLQAEDAIFPCALCHKCFWFDPKVDSMCGVNDWPRSAIEEGLRSSDKAAGDLVECPLRY